MDLNNIHNIYLVGIGGIGMSALARYFHSKGHFVAGYDLTPSPLTHDLEQVGIGIHYEAAIGNIPKRIFDKENTWIIRTPAVPDDHPELVYFRQNGFTVKKRAEVLGMIFNRKKGIAIAGTHGKTSVSSISAYIMSLSKQGCSAFLGGILKNGNTNLILNEESPWVIAEADEYDRSFLKLHPDIALVTWIDVDHLDIYKTYKVIQESFIKFLQQVKSGGSIIIKRNIDLKFDSGNRTLYTYALNDTSADFYASHIQLDNAQYQFDIVTPTGTIKDVRLLYPGLINVENAVASAAIAFTSGVDIPIIKKSLCNFKGIQRRFDIQYESPECIYIDDYAHHPRELDAIIGSVRKLYHNKKLTGVFQPHLFSRTRDFASEFARSLSALDELILLDIYPAREQPIEGVSSKMIFEKVKLDRKHMCRRSELLELLRWKPIEILLTMGAGDIDRLVEPIKKLVASR